MADSASLRLTCPVCETRLKISTDIERFACLSCGTELQVVQQGGVAQLVPSEASAAEMSDSQQRLIEVNTTLKNTDDYYGVGCAVATMAITLTACVFLAVSVVLQSTLLFWITIAVGLVLLVGVLFLFTTASSRSTDPLIRQRDELQTQLEYEETDADEALSDTEPEDRTRSTGA